MHDEALCMYSSQSCDMMQQWRMCATLSRVNVAELWTAQRMYLHLMIRLIRTVGRTSAGGVWWVSGDGHSGRHDVCALRVGAPGEDPAKCVQGQRPLGEVLRVPHPPRGQSSPARSAPAQSPYTLYPHQVASAQVAAPLSLWTGRSLVAAGRQPHA